MEKSNMRSKMPSFDTNNDKSSKKKKAGSATQILLGLVLILLIACGTLIYLYLEERKVTIDSTAQSQDTQKIIEDLNKLILLPDETPTIATVTDKDKLIEENPDFYESVNNGDKLIIYEDKAILYRPSSRLILNVAPVVRNKPVEPEDSLQQDPNTIPEGTENSEENLETPTSE